MKTNSRPRRGRNYKIGEPVEMVLYLKALYLKALYLKALYLKALYLKALYLKALYLRAMGYPKGRRHYIRADLKRGRGDVFVETYNSFRIPAGKAKIVRQRVVIGGGE